MTPIIIIKERIAENERLAKVFEEHLDKCDMFTADYDSYNLLVREFKGRVNELKIVLGMIERRNV